MHEYNNKSWLVVHTDIKSLLQIVTSTSKNNQKSKSSKVRCVGTFLHVKRELGCWLLTTFASARLSRRVAVLKRCYPFYKCSFL